MFELPIWVTPLLNGTALFVLATCHPGAATVRASVRELGVWAGLVPLAGQPSREVAARRASFFGGASGLAFSALVIGFVAVPGWRNLLFPGWFGDPPIVAAPVNLGKMVVGEEHAGTVRLVNYSGVPVRVIGSSRSCTCVSLVEDSAEIPAGGSLEIAIKARPTKPGFFHQRLVFFVDHPPQTRVWGDVTSFVSISCEADGSRR